MYNIDYLNNVLIVCVYILLYIDVFIYTFLYINRWLQNHAVWTSGNIFEQEVNATTWRWAFRHPVILPNYMESD